MASQKVGSWAFLLAMVIAIIAGLAMTANLVPSNVASWVALVLVILGLIVGFLNINDKHVTDFLVAVVAVAIVGVTVTAGGFSGINGVDMIGSLIANIVGEIVLVAAPAGLVVGLKQIWNLSKEQA